MTGPLTGTGRYRPAEDISARARSWAPSAIPTARYFGLHLKKRAFVRSLSAGWKARLYRDRQRQGRDHDAQALARTPTRPRKHGHGGHRFASRAPGQICQRGLQERNEAVAAWARSWAQEPQRPGGARHKSSVAGESKHYRNGHHAPEASATGVGVPRYGTAVFPEALSMATPRFIRISARQRE